jgi:hypothetical protein
MDDIHNLLGLASAGGKFGFFWNQIEIIKDSTFSSEILCPRGTSRKNSDCYILTNLQPVKFTTGD